MEKLYSGWSHTFFAILILITLSACAGSDFLSSSSGVKEYDQSYDKMVEVVEQAIKSSNMNISFTNESDDGNKTIITVSGSRYVGSEEVQQEQGEVRIINLDENITRIEVENPDYHFSVPEHQREDYQRIIFTRIDKTLEK